MAVGISMVIDDKFLERLSAADTKLEELAKKSEDVRGRVIQSFKSMGDDGVGYFIQKINEAKAALNGLNVNGSISLDLKGLDKIPQSATVSADNINTLITSITKLAEANASTMSSSKSFSSYLKEMFSGVKEKISDVERLAKAEEALIKQNEILSRMQTATLSQKQKNADYEIQLLASKQKTDAITAERNATAELATAESNRHKEAMNQLSAEAREIQARGIEQKRIADEKVNDAKRSTIAVKEEENAIKQSLAEQRRAAMDITLETKKYRNQVKLAAEEDKTATMQAIAAEKERQAQLKRSMEEVKRLAKSYKEMPTLMTGETLGKLLGESASAVSINQRIVAIHNLKNSLKDLDTTDVEYKKNVERVNAEIARLTKELNGLGAASNNVQKSHRNLMDISGQLARKLALVFSVSQIQGYMSKLVAIRGEFELQQKSLQVLLQNKDEANKLWQQTVELAVKSPFRVGELVSYTRQLAAYRIETSKLHETTKKLADVSAGLGVDMNRLILAYGQVRAAEYLRGTELRQFTEAGIPMLDELAKRFTQLEGRAVSAGDVFERISKRLVSFKDVAAVFDTMTSAGGTFYRMQEEQSETLKGMISNLRDSFDLMMNDIGKSNEDVLKGTVSTIRKLVDNWETIANILKIVISLIAVYRMGMLLTSKTMIESAVAANIANDSLAKQITATQLVSLGWKRLGASVAATSTVLKASLPFLAASVLVGGVIQLISVLREHSKQIEEINEKYAKLRDRLRELSYAFNSAVDEKDIASQKKNLQSLIDMANNEYHMKIKVDLTGATEEDVQKKFSELQAQLTGVNAYANLFEKAMQKSTEWNWSDIFDKTKKMSDAMQSAYSTFAANVASDVAGMSENFDKLSESEKAAFDVLKQPKKIDESDVEYLKRLSKGYSLLIKDAREAVKTRDQYSTQQKEYLDENAKVLKIFDRFNKIGVDYLQILEALTKQEYAQATAQKAYNNVLAESKELFTSLENLPEEEKEIRLKAAIDKIAAKKTWDEFVKDYIMQWTEQPFNIKFRVVPDEKKPLSVWQENYNKQFKGYYGYQKIENADTTREKEVQRINGLLKEQKDLVERIQKAGTGKGTAYEGYNLEEEKRKVKELQKQRDWHGVSEKKMGDAQNKILNNRISLIKELNKEYEKLNKTMSSDESKRRVSEAYTHTFTQAFGGESISFDFTNLKGVVEQLKKLAPLAAKEGAEAQLALSKEISEVQAEIDVQVNIEDDEYVKRRISEVFGSYELSLELDKLNVPHDLAKQLFDIDVFDMGSLKESLNDATRGLLDSVYKMAQIENTSNAESLSNNEEYLKMKQDIDKRYSQADIEIARDAAKKLVDMEDKASLERLKKYTGYLVAAQSEAVKIKLEEARQIAEIESISEMNPAQKEVAKSAVREEAQKKLDKQQWEDFKNTDMYIELFEDLDYVSTNTLNRMKAKLVEIRDSINNLDPSQLKDIAKRIDDVNKALVSKNPFKNILYSVKNVVAGYKEYNEAANKALASQQELEGQQKIVDNLQLQIEAQKKVVYEKNKSSKSSSAEKAVEVTYLSLLENQLAEEKQILNTKKQQADYDEKEKNNKKEILGLSKEQLSEASKLLNEQLSYLNDIKESWSGVFGGMSEGLSDAFDTIQEIGSGVSSILDGISKGPTGLLQAAAGIFQVIGGLFSIGDKKKERQIQRETKKVEDLQHAYEKLEKAIDDAYSIDTLERSNKNAKANLQAQLESYNKMIAAEEAKKKTDDERIKEWKYAIEDLKEQIKELDEQAFNQATGNIIDNVLNAATEFTDAWLEAFKETGDGLSGLEDDLKETVANMLKQQASMLITSTYVEKWKKNLEKYINTDDLELTTTEAKQWVEGVKNTLPQLSNALTEYFNAMKSAGIDLAGGNEMSGLTRSIQGITESQADIFAAYANSCRFFLANIDATLTSVANQILGGENMPNPILSELKTQTELVRGISTLLNSVVRGSHSMGGQGIKVFIS